MLAIWFWVLLLLVVVLGVYVRSQPSAPAFSWWGGGLLLFLLFVVLGLAVFGSPLK